MGVDVVDEREGVLVVPVLVLQGDVDLDVVLDGREGDHLRVQRLLVPVQPFHELDQAALGEELLLLHLVLPLVAEDDRDALVQERELTEAVGERRVAELQHREHFGVGLEGDGGAGALGLAEDAERLGGLATGKGHVMPAAVAVHHHLEPLREGVDHRHADAVQAAGHLVGRLVKLATGVQHRQRQFDAGNLLDGMDIDRNTATVVDHGNDVVFLDGDGDQVAVAGQRLVDRVVHHLVHEMVQPVLPGGPDVHGRPLPDRLQPLQNLDGTCAVFLPLRCCDLLVCHVCEACFRVGRSGVRRYTEK